MKKIFSSALVLLMLSSCASKEIYIYSKKEDSLEKIAQRNFDHVKIKYRNTEEYQKDILKWNPDIRSWQEMEKDQMIYIDYPYTEYVGQGAIPEKNQED